MMILYRLQCTLCIMYRLPLPGTYYTVPLLVLYQVAITAFLSTDQLGSVGASCQLERFVPLSSIVYCTCTRLDLRMATVRMQDGGRPRLGPDHKKAAC